MRRLRKLFANVVLRRRQLRAALPWVWCAAWGIFVLTAASVFSRMFWCWLSDGESGSTTIRNLGLVVAAIVGLPIAIWRSVVAGRQATAAQRQAEIAQRGLLNDRYQKGTEMLGSAVLSVRFGGIYSLDRLAKNHAEDHHIQIKQLFSAFIRNPPKDQWEDNPDNDKKVQINSSHRLRDPDPKVREDIQAVMECLGNRNEEQREIEDREGYILDLTNTNLSGVKLYEADLFWAFLQDTDLRHADLVGTDLSHARLVNADLSYANLGRAILAGADLSGARLLGVHLSGANLSGTILSYSDFVGSALPKDLTQEQLERAVADPDKPPILTDSRDYKTGKLLIWRGASTSV